MSSIHIDLGDGKKLSIEGLSTVVPGALSEEAFDFNGVFDGESHLVTATEACMTAGFTVALLSDLEKPQMTSSEGIVGQAVGAAKQIVATVIKALQSIIQWCDSMVTYIVQRIQGAYFKSQLAGVLKNHTKEEFVKLYPSVASTEIVSQFTTKFDERAKGNLDAAISLAEQYISAINLNVNVNEVDNPDDVSKSGTIEENDAKIKTFYQKLSGISGTPIDEQTSHGNGRKVADKIILQGKGVGDTPDRAKKATIDTVYGQDYLLSIVMRGADGFGEDFKHFALIAKTIRNVKIKTQMVLKLAQVKAAAVGKDNGGGNEAVKLISKQAKVLNFISQFMNEAIHIYLAYMTGAVHAIKVAFATGKAGTGATGQVTADDQAKYEGRAQAINDKTAGRQNMGTRADKIAAAKKERDEAIARVDERLRQEEAQALAEEQAAKDARAKARAKKKRADARKAAADQRKQIEDSFRHHMAQSAIDTAEDTQ